MEVIFRMRAWYKYDLGSLGPWELVFAIALYSSVAGGQMGTKLPWDMWSVAVYSVVAGPCAERTSGDRNLQL